MVRVVLEGDEEWAEAAKDDQEFLVLCLDEREKTGGHGQRTR